MNRDFLFSVMSTVHYFDIFSHPLQKEELLYMNHFSTISNNELSEALSYLTENSFLNFYNGYYLPDTDFTKVERRRKGLELTRKYETKAFRRARLISRFPFTRGVMISGSMSKGFMNEFSDIDFLVITQPGRLWVARTLLTLYKKIFLLNSHKFFCLNYFLDEKNLELNDRNLFTATELLFVKPVFNEKLYRKFLDVNQWTNKYYPSLNAAGREIDIHENPALKYKSFFERLLNGKAGDYLDLLGMKISNSFWKNKFKNMSHDRYNRDMKSEKGVSKHHPNGFRDQVLDNHKKRMELFTGQLSAIKENLPVSELYA